MWTLPLALLPSETGRDVPQGQAVALPVLVVAAVVVQCVDDTLGVAVRQKPVETFGRSSWPLQLPPSAISLCPLSASCRLGDFGERRVRGHRLITLRQFISSSIRQLPPRGIFDRRIRGHRLITLPCRRLLRDGLRVKKRPVTATISGTTSCSRS
jgi:hypothetical protein